MTKDELQQAIEDEKVKIVKRLQSIRGGVGTYAYDEYLILIENRYYISIASRHCEAEKRETPVDKVWKFPSCEIFTTELHYGVFNGETSTWDKDGEHFIDIYYKNELVNPDEKVTYGSPLLEKRIQRLDRQDDDLGKPL